MRLDWYCITANLINNTAIIHTCNLRGSFGFGKFA